MFSVGAGHPELPGVLRRNLHIDIAVADIRSAAGKFPAALQRAGTFRPETPTETARSARNGDLMPGGSDAAVPFRRRRLDARDVPAGPVDPSRDE